MAFGNLFGKKAQVSTSSAPSLDTQLLQILTELTKDDVAKNTPLIEEIVKTIVADSKNPQTDLQVTIKKTKVGLEELLKDVSEPNADLIDQLFSLIVVSKSKETIESKQEEENAKAESGEVRNDPSKTSTQNISSDKSASQDNTVQSPPVQEKLKDDTLESSSGQAMLGLMMDEIKELVIISSKVNKKVQELETKNTTIVESLQSDQSVMKKEVEDMKTKVETMEKSIEKFIGLYEVISNMYNPFMKEEDKKKPSDSNTQESSKEENTASEENFFDAQIDKQKDLTKTLKKE